MKNKKISVLVLIVLVLTLILVFTLKGNSNSLKNFDGEVKEFDIIAEKWMFKPEIIEVNKGDKVIFNMESVDIPHGVSLPEFGVAKLLKPGKKVKLEFIADKEGEFYFSCNVFCGKGHGEMNGKLVVRE